MSFIHEKTIGQNGIALDQLPGAIQTRISEFDSLEMEHEELEEKDENAEARSIMSKMQQLSTSIDSDIRKHFAEMREDEEETPKKSSSYFPLLG